MKKKESKNNKIYSYIAISITFLVMFIFVYNQFTKSLFVTSRDRINIVLYDSKPRIYSFGLRDGIHYYISFSPDTRVDVPGGYGYYRLGALGKLVDLEKNPDIFQKAFSSASSSFIDRYFYDPHTQSVFYGKVTEEDPPIPRITEWIKYKSDANIFDRLFIILFMLGKRNHDFTNLLVQVSHVDTNVVLSDDEFVKSYQGYLYQKKYRDERKTIQLYYGSSYKTAVEISKIIEGEGIRVVDLTKLTKTTKECKVVESGKEFSQTSRALSTFFHCSLIFGKTDLSDILLILSEPVEKKWEVTDGDS